MFEGYAERTGEGSPLRTAIPTMQTVGLANDFLPPLEEGRVLLLLSLFAAAATRDAVMWMNEFGALR